MRILNTHVNLQMKYLHLFPILMAAFSKYLHNALIIGHKKQKIKIIRKKRSDWKINFALNIH